MNDLTILFKLLNVSLDRSHHEKNIKTIVKHSENIYVVIGSIFKGIISIELIKAHIPRSRYYREDLHDNTNLIAIIDDILEV